MRRTIALALACALAPAIAAAQNPPVQQASMQTAAAKIASAMTAAPMAVSAQATIMDWPSTPNGQPAELRHGSNGWVCFPDMPQTQGNDPMCMDAQWQKWGEAYMTHAAPQITGLGIGYMLTASGEVRPLEDMENEIIRFAISHYRGQMSEVARRLKIGRSTLYRKLDESAADDPAEGGAQDAN